MPRVAVVTDSTASLPSPVAQELGIVVVPLQVVIGSRSFDDGVDEEASPQNLAHALRAAVQVSTSRPTPAALLEVYRAVAADGVEEVVSVHLSSEVSATVESAVLAAGSSPVPVHVVDSRLVGPGTGLAAVRAAEVLRVGGDAAAAVDAAQRRAEDTAAFFCVDTLEHLRRGGRVSAAAALLGSALAVKPILQVRAGRVAPREKVRTSARALVKLQELAVDAAGSSAVDVTVCHLANLAGAEELSGALSSRLAEGLQGRAVEMVEVGAVLGAHVGPGLVGVTIAPH